MTPTTLLAALAGALIGLGIVVIAAGWIRTEPRPRSRPATVSPTRGWRRWRWPTVAAAALVTWALTGWPAAGLIIAAAVIGLPPLLVTSRMAARSIERVEAMEEWARRLADILSVGVGLEQGIVTSVRSVPTPIRAEVTVLAARLGARVPTETALRTLADDLNDATGDLVVAALLLAHRRRGPGIARTLTAVADSVAEEVAARRKVEADRAKPRTTARAVTLITLGVVAVGFLNGIYIAPYGTPLGQLVLVGITGTFVAALAWMRALTLGQAQPRLIAATAPEEARP
jgi:tight adherence protein B